MNPEELEAFRLNIAINEPSQVVLEEKALRLIDRQAARITKLVAQVAALKEIAVDECAASMSENGSPNGPLRRLARRQLTEEHPEAFCPPAESDWGVTCRRTTYRTLHTPAPLTGRSDDPL